MLEWLFQKIFVAIIPFENLHEVVVLTIKNKKIINTVRRSFEGSEPSNAMNNFILEKIDASPLFYISILNLASNQGVYEGCTKLETHENGVQIKTLCRDNQWMQYASNDDLLQLQERYAKVGLDFIFSPFSLIEHYFDDKIKGSLAVYAFSMPNLFSVTIFEAGRLEYGYYYNFSDSTLLATEEEEKLQDNHDERHSSDEEDESVVRLDKLEELEELDLMDDLESFDDLNAFGDISEVSEEASLITEEGLKETLERGDEEYRCFEAVQKTLERFYASEQCRNRFIETIYIADSRSGGNELKRYLEEELFLAVSIRHVDIGEGINALARKEEEML